MKKSLLVLHARFTLLLLVIVAASVIDLHAQCSASISSGSQTICAGAYATIPVTLNGTAPFTYTYSINGAAQQVVTASSNFDQLVINNFLGQVNVVVLTSMEDATGCQGTISGSFTVNLSQDVFVDAQVTHTSCLGASNDGSIALFVSGGQQPYVYNWSHGLPGVSFQQNLGVGTYDVTVADANGCIATTSANIYLATPTSHLQSAGITCNGSNNGSINLTTNVACSFQWSTGAVTEDITGLGPGIYSVTITDIVNQCTSVGSVLLNEPSDITVNTTVNQPACGGAANGSISLVITGGISPYTYVWSNGSTTSNVTNLAVGNYTGTVTDNNGCSKSFTVTLTSLPQIEVVPTIQHPGCGANDGGIDLSITGGLSPYQAAWSNGSVSEDLMNVGTGAYSVTITDAAGCTFTAAYSIGPLNLSAQVNIAQCLANIDLSTGGGTGPYVYLWSNGSVQEDLNNISAGTYTVTVTDATGCTSIQSVSVSISSVSVYIVNGPANCLGTGSLEAFGPDNATYVWSNGSNTKVISGLSSGTYSVTVTGSNGCTASATRLLQVQTPLSVSWVVNNTNCNGGLGSINLTVSGGVSPYMYAWRDQTNNLVSVSQDPIGLPAGIYRVTVTGATGCSYTSPDIEIQQLSLIVTPVVLSVQCNSITMTVEVTGGTAPYQYSWLGPNNFASDVQNISIAFSGTYTVAVVDATGCIAQASYEANLGGSGPCGFIGGKVLRDELDNCLADAGEPGLGGWLVRAQNASEVFYGVSDQQGNYYVQVPNGTYTMAAIPPNALWGVCPSVPAVTVENQMDTFPGGDLLVKSLYQCPSLSVWIGTSILRRCFTANYYYVNYCNNGTMPEQAAYVLVSLDPFLIPLNSNIPYTNLGGGVLRFEVGDLAVGECGSFSLQVQVSCSAALGQTHCTEAHIYPDGNCLPTDPEWSGASLRVSSQCSQDSVRFTIKNIGAGDMEEISEYIVVEDAVMLMQAPFQLGSGDSTTVVLPANGSTWRMEVDQVPFHPGMSAPALSVEGCTTAPSFSTGYVMQFPNDEADAWIDIDCTENIGSYDPNDKQGFPVGYGEAHYIRPGTELEYLIRFQNTGTDTAFTVRIVDTLSLWLDPTTIRPGVSSHPYQFNFTGQGIAEFLFENILLPDSNVNQVASNGFVKFSIYPRADAPLETLIENSAAIYFDFNEPVITNTTRHRLGENFLMTVGAWQPQRPEYEVLVSPNPFSASARLEVKGLTSTQPIHLQIIDLQGTIVHDEMAAGPVLDLKKGSLKSGMYLFRIDQKGVMIGNGKLVVKD